MATITINGQMVETREGIPVLRAALEAGLDIPHYCYHPGLSVVASCRLCLMEMKMPDPRTKELAWVPKLFPSCQTPVKNGMEVRFDSPKVKENQEHVMEYYLLNHPLDCPVCDKAGECYLQDYSEGFGHATSRMVEDKHKNPKKDIGSKTLLYQDRCVLCTRCVRFCDEVAGDAELSVVNRGSRGEIDVFPGVPLENKLQGNVVDICPVGALLDKDFLFKQRVWLLQPKKSVCPGCARGCSVTIDQNEDVIYRVKPRFNEKVNEWWICDDGRFGWKYVHDTRRLNTPLVRGAAAGTATGGSTSGGAQSATNGDRPHGGAGGVAISLHISPASRILPGCAPTAWEQLPALVREGLRQAGGPIAAVLSPMLSCEEAWLLAKFIRGIDANATLVSGYVPVLGQDEVFKKGFTIKAEKCPNRRGVADVIRHFGGATLDWNGLIQQAGSGAFRAAYVTGGYPSAWLTADAAAALAKIPYVVAHDLFESALTSHAAVVIPSATWAEREGSFMNADGLLQVFERAITPLDGVKNDGQFLFELAGETGFYRAARYRAKMAKAVAAFGAVFTPQEEPVHAH